jgi:Spy/CpxP family protein refolding chaperone
MHTLGLSMVLVAIMALLPFSVAAQSSPQQEQVDPQHMDMMQGQGSAGGTGMGGGMGMGYGPHEYCMEQQGRGDMHGRGMMGGAGRGGGMALLGPLRMLGLNPDQRTRINKIELDLRKQLYSLKGNTLDAQAQLYDLYSADKPDPKRIGAVYGKIFDVRRQMIEARIGAMNRARDVLSKEQLAKLKQLQQDPHDWSPDLLD